MRMGKGVTWGEGSAQVRVRKSLRGGGVGEAAVKEQLRG